MYPERLLDADVKSEAERKVFKALEAGLGDDWEVFHSASLIARDPVKGAVDDEIDFVLCHPDKAILCLEVKGGGIECRHGQWRRREGNKSEWMPDPFTQALDHRYSLERKIAEVDGWKRRVKETFLVHGLAFPQISVQQLALAPDAPLEIIIDRNGLGDVGAAIKRILAYHRGARDKRVPPGEDGATMLRDLLAPRIAIEVPLAERFLEEEEQLIELTVGQSRLLNVFGRNRRLLVTGCAGSGKTLLAVERAKRLVKDGQEVLFVCFNKRLRNHLAETERASGIDFYTFHGLCRHLAGRAGIKLTNYAKDETPPPEFWNEELPDALVEALERLGPRYDALFVDEAQDLETEWLDALLLTLRDEASAYIWLFMDANQQVYGANFEEPEGFVHFDLDVNCRNTAAIHREVIKKYKGEVEPRVMGPEGRELELFETDDQAAKVASVLQRLCGREEVAPQDVVVLSSHGTASGNSRVAAAGRLGNYTLTEERGKLGNYVHFSSIRGFKGLESPVVILCELEDLDDESIDQQLYVGISRAKNHCVVVAPG